MNYEHDKSLLKIERRAFVKIAIFGVGGVGGYFGWRLAQAGEEVIFIARGEHLRMLNKVGLKMETPDGGSFVQPVQAVADPAQLGPVDAVILGGQGVAGPGGRRVRSAADRA